MKWILGCSAVLCAALSASAAQAAIVNSVTANSTTGISGLGSWPSPFTTTSNATPSQMTTSENNYGGSSLFSLAQSFTATATGNLTSIEIAISGTAPVNFNVALYSAGANDVTDIGGGSYTPGAGGYSSNLFTDTSTQTWTGYTAPNSTAAVLNFALSGADQVAVVAGQAYIFEISATTNPNGMVWFRNPNDPLNYAGGQAYRQRSSLNGNAQRDMSIAVNIAAVPEPDCAVLAGLGAIVLGLRRRQ